MAVERAYQAQRTVANPAGLPSASAASFGAGVGAAIAEAGQVLHRSEIQSYRIERAQAADAERTRAAVKLAGVRARLDQLSTDAKANRKPGAAGYRADMEAAFDRETTGILDDLAEDGVRRDVEAQLASMRGGFVANAHEFETVERAKQMATDVGLLGDQASARIFTATDPKAYPQETAAYAAMVHSLQGVPDAVKEGLLREGNAKLAVAQVKGMRARGQAPAAMALIDSGAFNDVLDGEQLAQLRAGAEVDVRRDQAAARAEQAAAIAATKDELGAKAVELDAGAGTVEDRQEMAAKYAALGDQSKAAEWQRKAGEFAAVQGSRDWTLPQMDGRIAALQAKQGKGGLSGGEAAELNGLTDQRRQTAARLNEPGGALMQWQYATGKPLAPVDPNDPASLARRARQAIVAAQTYGRATIEPLTETELPAFKDLMGNGPAGRLQALEVLRGFGDARVILGAARQMSGEGDGDFRIAARLLLQPGGREVARDVLRGREALKTTANNAWKEDQARRDFRSWYGSVLRDLPDDYEADLFEAAKAYYATRATGLGKYDPGTFAASIENVLGRNKVGGGPVRGGVAHTPRGLVLVPPTLTGEQLMQRFARSSPDEYRAAADGRVPKAPDGSPIGVRDFKQLLPTQLGDGRYGFRYPSGRFILDDRGQPYSVDVSRLPGWRAPK